MPLGTLRLLPDFLWLAPMLLLFSGPAKLSASDARGSSAMRHKHRHAYLHIVGTHIENADGREVALHGINLGGWFVTEGWMCGIVDRKDTLEANGKAGVAGRSMWEDLEDRFGAENEAALMRAWQDNWITAQDLDKIRDGGFNMIRVPFSYRTLQRADGNWILDEHGEIDFSRMDWIVREAAKRGLYTIFDLHVWPEQRHAYDKIGRSEGAPIRDAMAKLWTVVAAHYRGNGDIAALDLINEFPGNWGVQPILSRAVSAGDPERVQVIEGYTMPEFIKLNQAKAFNNAVYSTHFYGAKPLTTDEINARLKETAASPVPVYIGEFYAADFTGATQAMNAAKVAWSSWTYKTVDMGEWGLFIYDKSMLVDVQNDSYDTILDKWSNGLSSWQRADVSANFSTNADRTITQPPKGQ